MPFPKIVKLVLHSAVSKPATRLYPARQRENILNTRGAIQNRIEQCIFCGICVQKCPADALKVSRPDKQWSIDRFRCVVCGACVLACPKKCLDMMPDYTSPATQKSVDRYNRKPDPE